MSTADEPINHHAAAVQHLRTAETWQDEAIGENGHDDERRDLCLRYASLAMQAAAVHAQLDASSVQREVGAIAGQWRDDMARATRVEESPRQSDSERDETSGGAS